MAQTTILKNNRCKNCNWPVVFALCNDGMGVHQPYAEWDWWYYCSNKCCENHAGEGVFQNYPSWVENKDPK